MIPIKVEKSEPQSYKIIEWLIHNVCNNDCSFCGSEFKDGSQRWLSLDEYKKILDKLIEAAGTDPVWIQITGGEPTLFPELLELLAYIKSKNAYTSLISNGSRTIRWWEELKQKKVLDQLCISYHSEQTTNYKHITDVINLFHDEPTDVVCLVTHVETSIDLAFEAVTYIKENTGCIVVFKAIMMQSYDIFEKYSPEQLKILKSVNAVTSTLRKTKKSSNVPDEHQIRYKVTVTYDNGKQLKMSPQKILKDRHNIYTGWLCDFGRQFMRIEGTNSYRGLCKVSGATNIFSDKFGFTDDFISCTSKQCVCAADLVATKIRAK